MQLITALNAWQVTYALIKLGQNTCLISYIIQKQQHATLILNLYKEGNTATVKVHGVAMEYCENSRYITRIIGILREIMSEEYNRLQPSCHCCSILALEINLGFGPLAFDKRRKRTPVV